MAPMALRRCQACLLVKSKPSGRRPIRWAHRQVEEQVGAAVGEECSAEGCIQLLHQR